MKLTNKIKIEVIFNNQSIPIKMMFINNVKTLKYSKCCAGVIFCSLFIINSVCTLSYFVSYSNAYVCTFTGNSSCPYRLDTENGSYYGNVKQSIEDSNLCNYEGQLIADICTNIFTPVQFTILEIYITIGWIALSIYACVLIVVIIRNT